MSEHLATAALRAWRQYTTHYTPEHPHRRACFDPKTTEYVCTCGARQPVLGDKRVWFKEVK
jgi:hypothetical protein